MFPKFPVKLLSASIRSLNQTATKAASAAISMDDIQRERIESNYRFNFAMPTDTPQILNFLEKNYFCQDSLSKSLNLCCKSLDMSMKLYIKDSLSQGMSVIARRATEREEIIGISINQKSCKWDGDRLDELARASENINTRKLLHIWALLAREPSLHDYVSQLSIFDLRFLSVKKEFRDGDLATELTKNSLSLGRDMNFKFARIDSTSEHTTRLAQSFNMEKLWEVSYKNILSDDGRTPLVIPDRPNTDAAVFCANLESLPYDLNCSGRNCDDPYDY